MSIYTVLMILAIIGYMIIPSLKDRVISVKKLVILPAVFIYSLYQTITENLYFDLNSAWIIVFGVIIGVIVGISIRWNTHVKADRNKQLIWLPGTYVNLLLFIAIFSVHFIIGYLQSTNAAILHSSNTAEEILLFTISIISSITVGSSFCLCYKYLTIPTDLNVKLNTINS